jgi:hypothetical protein
MFARKTDEFEDVALDEKPRKQLDYRVLVVAAPHSGRKSLVTNSTES